MSIRETPAHSSLGSTGSTATRTVLVSGASGLVGKAFVAALEAKGDRVVRLVRRRDQVGPDALLWDPSSGETVFGDPGPIDAVVHLAGENVGEGRWTTAKKKRIRDSRVDGTRLLIEALGRLPEPPSVFICASAVGVYGDRGDQMVDEGSASGGGFLAAVCREWEEQAEGARAFASRVVNLRFGVVLSKDGGALGKMLLPFKMGAGGIIGSGKQWMSWVALPDVVSAIEHALDRDDLDGPVNVVAPEPVTNRGFTKALGRALGRPTIFPMPAFAAKLAFGEMAEEMLLSSTRARPGRLEATGFGFRFADIDTALANALV